MMRDAERASGSRASARRARGCGAKECGGLWPAGEVIERRSKDGDLPQYYVHFVGQDRRLDEWVDAARLGHRGNCARVKAAVAVSVRHSASALLTDLGTKIEAAPLGIWANFLRTGAPASASV